MEILLFMGAIFAFAMTVAYFNHQKQREALVPAEDTVHREEVVGGAILRSGEAQELVERTSYSGNQPRVVAELQNMEYVEVQAAGPGPVLRIASLPEPQRTLARSLDGDDVYLADDRVRITWREGRRTLAEVRPRALLLYSVLRFGHGDLFRPLAALANGPDRAFVLERVLTHLATVPGIEALAQAVRPSDPIPLRQAAAWLLGRAEEALGLALAEGADPAAGLRAVDRFGAEHPDAADRVLAGLLSTDAAAGVEARVRALPEARAAALLAPMVALPRALALLAEVAPAAARPHLLAAVHRSRPGADRLPAALWLVPIDHEAAEATLIDLLEEPDSVRLGAINALAAHGTERSLPALRELLDANLDRAATEAAEQAVAEIRARLAHRPVGALALAAEGGGGLALADDRVGGLVEPEG